MRLIQPGHPLFYTSASKAKLPGVGKSDFTTVLGKLIFIKLWWTERGLFRAKAVTGGVYIYTS